MSTWRIGERIPLNVYEDDRPVCQCHTAVDAQRIAAAMNWHVVLLEALKKLREWDKKWPKRAYIVEYGMISQSERELNEICELAEAAIQQAERGQ